MAGRLPAGRSPFQAKAPVVQSGWNLHNSLNENRCILEINILDLLDPDISVDW